MFRPLEKALCCAVLFPVLLCSQRPRMPGKLTITSTPAGATISIDGKATELGTPSTVVVAPGQHRVSIDGANVAQCGQAHPATVTVTAGSTWVASCEVGGWKVEPKAAK
jgi:hypothetical protein